MRRARNRMRMRKYQGGSERFCFKNKCVEKRSGMKSENERENEEISG